MKTYKKLFFLFSLFLSSSSILLGFKLFVLVSAPGSGKGTLSNYLAANYNYVHINPGDIFRKEIALQTPLGKKVQPFVEQGVYVDQSIVAALVAEYVRKACQENRNIIVDGFPTTPDTFLAFQKILHDNNLENEVCFIQLLVEDETCVQRMANRIACVTCSRIYNHISLKPETHMLCQNCGSPLLARTADTVEIARKRVQKFHDTVEPILQIIAQNYPVKRISTALPLAKLMCEYDKLITA